MTDDVTRRSEIDSDTVRGLLLINGGGAVALLAFLSSIIRDPSLSMLSQATIWATFLFQFGLVSAIVHNRLRRICSLEYSRPLANRKQCRFRGKILAEPCVCHWSIGFLWASVGCFVLAGLIVFGAGLYVTSGLSVAEPSISPSVANVAIRLNPSLELTSNNAAHINGYAEGVAK